MVDNINFPTLDQITQRILLDAQSEFEDGNTFFPVSYLKAYLQSNAARYFEEYNKLQEIYNLLYLNTTSDDFLNQWGALFGIVRLPESIAAGPVTIAGLSGTLIPSGTILLNSVNESYETIQDVTIVPINLNVSLSNSGGIAEAVTSVEHNFATGLEVTISGATSSEYNGAFAITVLDPVTFEYTIGLSPPQGDSGVASTTIASVEINSLSFGSDTNLPSGYVLIFQNFNPNIITNAALVQIEGITGGRDAETDTSYREALLSRLQNPVANFSISAIKEQAFLIGGVTRVTVYDVTENNISPIAGYVTIFFLRDNDEIIIPTPSEVTQVRDSILLIKPAGVPEENVIVHAPSPRTINFNFIQLSPDTTSMKEAIKNNLIQFFKNNANVGINILELGYNSAIFNTVDPQTGEKVISFELSNPTGDIDIDYNEIGIFGVIQF